MASLGGALSVYLGVTILAAIETLEMIIVLIIRVITYLTGDGDDSNTQGKYKHRV